MKIREPARVVKTTEKQCKGYDEGALVRDAAGVYGRTTLVFERRGRRTQRNPSFEMSDGLHQPYLR